MPRPHTEACTCSRMKQTWVALGNQRQHQQQQQQQQKMAMAMIISYLPNCASLDKCWVVMAHKQHVCICVMYVKCIWKILLCLPVGLCQSSAHLRLLSLSVTVRVIKINQALLICLANGAYAGSKLLTWQSLKNMWKQWVLTARAVPTDEPAVAQLHLLHATELALQKSIELEPVWTHMSWPRSVARPNDCLCSGSVPCAFGYGTGCGPGILSRHSSVDCLYCPCAPLLYAFLSISALLLRPPGSHLLPPHCQCRRRRCCHPRKYFYIFFWAASPYNS